MLAKRQRKTDLKKDILREVFHDNLRMTGKLAGNHQPSARILKHRKLHRTVLIALAVLLGSFFARDISLSINRTAPPLPQAAAPTTMPITKPIAVKPADIAVDDGSAEVVIPIWDFVLPEDQDITDYDLLLSRNGDVRVSDLFGLNVKTIVIDPGHGGTDPGAIGAMGTQEKEITLDVALRLKERLLKLGGYNVLLTRDSDTTLALVDRVNFAKEHKADLFISVHVNSLPDHAVNIIETYYFGPPLNSETMQLAEQENKGSHFTIRELDAIVKDISNTLKRQESARLAMAIQESLFRNVRSHDAKVRNEGIKMAPFVVISQTKIPSVLVEISCLTKKKEEAKLASPAYRDKIAAYMQEGIVSYLDIKNFNNLRGEK